MLKAGLAYFGLVFGTGFVLGIVRVLLLEPRVGERAAELAEMPLMLLVIWLAAGYVCRRYRARLGTAGWAVVGALALLLLLAAELGLVLFSGSDIATYLAGRDPVSGGAYLFALALFTAMPWLRARSIQ